MASDTTARHFVVIEGLDCAGKTTLVERLSLALGAQSLRSPPTVMAEALAAGDLRQHFDAQPAAVRRQYYRFTNLVASEQARTALATGKDVVMDRYWTSTAAFSALDATGPVAEFNDGYPPELLVPDLVILLTVDETHRRERLSRRGLPATEEELKLAEESAGRQAVLQAYRRFGPVEVDTSELDEQGVFDMVLAVLCQKFSRNDVSHSTSSYS